jgi:outer membrane protein TolC
MKKYIVLIVGCFLVATVIGYSQSFSSLTIDSCFAMAKRQYPLTKQYSLIEKTREYSIDNANKGYLPQFSISGQATYQSEVTQLPIELPNTTIEPLSKDQYKLYGEVTQPITDLFTMKDHKELIKANSQIDEQKLEVELYKLRERINNLFFGILLIDAQIQQTELLKKDVQIGIEKINVAIENGTALKSSANNLRAELLKVNQRVIEFKATRRAYVDMLSIFIGKPISDGTQFISPSSQTISNSINRPELLVYDFQKKAFDLQNKLITAKNLPRFSLFLQGGFGRPALNVLSNEFAGYYIGGLRLNWNLGNLYTYRKEKKIVALSQQGVEIQRDVFLFNTNVTIKQQNSEITKMQELIATDNEIVILRESIKNETRQQLEFGTATTNDYMIAVNAQDQAQQNLLLRHIQLLLAHYNYQLTTGN